MELAEWQVKQVEAAKALTQQGSQALRQNQMPVAEAALTEAAIILDMVEQPTVEVNKVRAQIFNEVGFIRHRQNQLDEAQALHERAVGMCDELMAAGEEFRGNTAATAINLAGILAQKGDFARAQEVNQRAVDLAEQLFAEGASGQASNLAFGANQNLAVIAGRAGDFETANKAMERALEVAEALSDDLKKQMAVQIAQGAQQLSVMMFQQEQKQDALKWGRVAEIQSEKAYDTHGEQVLPVYVTSQINLISFFESVEEYANAENALFKALDVVGDHPQILERGVAFYSELRKLSNERLEAGNLPREEVEESYREVSKRFKAAKAKLEAAQAQAQAAQGQVQA